MVSTKGMVLFGLCLAGLASITAQQDPAPLSYNAAGHRMVFIVKRFLYNVVRPGLYHAVTVDFVSGRIPAVYVYNAEGVLLDEHSTDVTAMKFDELHAFVRAAGFRLAGEPEPEPEVEAAVVQEEGTHIEL
ncbi:hypothetical protein FOA52_001357 [Chlamydomonas sp. UWO 241]|nr:hypothetical protein FOA52_001357 [Chlamydomonas sp. UWO 241]